MTNISWTNATWNPVVGCTKVSQGCKNCYAKTLHDMRHRALLAGKTGIHPQYAKPFEVVQLMPARLDYPLHWRKPRRVFVNSVSDLFHEDVPEDFLDDVFATMALAPQHTFQILTKRPERMREYINSPGRAGGVAAYTGCGISGQRSRRFIRPDDMPWPLPNVWLGASVENQAAADSRIPELIATPAAVRFLSCEPLLGLVELREWLRDGIPTAEQIHGPRGMYYIRHGAPRLDWVIVGGESGPKYRPLDMDWLYEIANECRFAGVPLFVKQDSAPRSEQRGRIPDELWIREYPLEVVPA